MTIDPAWELDALGLMQTVTEGVKVWKRDKDWIERLYDYAEGRHDMPYIPDSADDEFISLARRAVVNLFPLLIDCTAQALYVDDYRHDKDAAFADETSGTVSDGSSPYWRHWQESHMDAIQSSLWREAAIAGHVFVRTVRRRDGKVLSVGMSPKTTVTLHADDDWLEPVGAVRILSTPRGEEPGYVDVWDETFQGVAEWRIVDGEDRFTIVQYDRHGAKSCPVTRIPCRLTLDGRAQGLIEGLMTAADRINQSVFDLSVARTYSSFVVRTVSGMAPPYKKTMNGDGEVVPVIDKDGNLVPDMDLVNGRRFFFAEDPDTKFGSLPAGDLGSLIDSVAMEMKFFSVIGQLPPHITGGDLVNASADALKAAAAGLESKNTEIATSFGEGVERVMRVFGEIAGLADADSPFGEVIWRDLSTASLAQAADALGKFAESLDIPKEGLWSRVPGANRGEINLWRRLRDEAAEDIPWQTIVQAAEAAGDTSLAVSDSQATAKDLAVE